LHILDTEGLLSETMKDKIVDNLETAKRKEFKDP
jgi:hypothetical protein